MRMMEDDCSVDTTSAVSEPNDKPRHILREEEITPFLSMGGEEDESSESSCDSESEKEEGDASPKNARFRVYKGAVISDLYDAEPVHRRMGTRNCQEPYCPNSGGKCDDHGKLRLTCKIRGCEFFLQTNGFCYKHHEKKYGLLDSGGQNHVGKNGANEKQKESKKKKRKHKCEEPSPSPSKPPSLLGPTNRDVALTMHNARYKSIMYERFRGMEASGASFAEVGREIFERFRAELDGSGGCFLKKSGEGFARVDDEEALRFITNGVKIRMRTCDKWSGVDGLPQEENAREEDGLSTTKINLTERDVALTLHDEVYKSIMYECLRNMEVTKAGKIEVAREIFKRFKTNLKESGGRFLKKKGTDFTEVDDEQALRVIIETIKGRKKETVDKRGDVDRTPQESNTHEEDDEPSPALLGQQKGDIVLSMWDKEYKTTMHGHFRSMEISKACPVEVCKEIFEMFKSKQKRSGGKFLKKNGDGFVQVDDTEALRHITQSVRRRNVTVDKWGSGNRTPQEKNSQGEEEELDPIMPDQKEQGIVLSMWDKEYKSTMHKIFRRMNRNSCPAEIAKTLFEGFKDDLENLGGDFFKRNGDGLIQVDEDEALCLITNHIRRRMKSYHIWGDCTAQKMSAQKGKRKSPDCDDEGSSVSPKKRHSLDHSAREGKRKSTNINDETLVAEAPSKKQKLGHDANNKSVTVAAASKSRKTRNSMESSTNARAAVSLGATCVEEPLPYVGNYVANLLQAEGGWYVANKKVDCVNYGQVLYRKGVSRKTAVEGRDKFTGYAKMARWAYANGYYKKHVVETEHGRLILKKVGILDDPYLIFMANSTRGSEKSPTENVEQREEEGNDGGGDGGSMDCKPAASGPSTHHGGGASNDDPIILEPFARVPAGDEEWSGLAGSEDEDDDDAAGQNGKRKPSASGMSIQRAEGSLNKNLIILEPPVPPPPAPPAAGQNRNHRSAASGASTRCAGALDDNPIIMEPPIPPPPPVPPADNARAPSDSAPVHIKDEEEGEEDNVKSNQNRSLTFGTDTAEFMNLFEDIQTKFDVATAEGDQYGVAFYTYLLNYFEAKARRGFRLGSDKEIINEKVKSFEDTKEKQAAWANKPGLGVYELLLTQVIDECKGKLPLE